MDKPSHPLRVGFILTKNFTLTALSNFVDVLRLAADDGDNSRPIRCHWHIMSDTDQPVRSSSDLLVHPNSRFIDPKELDYVVVVGGLLQRGPQIDEQTRKYLLAAAATNTNLVGVCTGSFVLWRLGLLRQRKCCISWYHYRDFLEEFGDTETLPVADQLFAIDGKRITCSGGIGVAYLAAHIVELRMGSSCAQKALHIMQIDRMKPGSTAQSAPPTEFIGEDSRISRNSADHGAEPVFSTVGGQIGCQGELEHASAGAAVQGGDRPGAPGGLSSPEAKTRAVDAEHQSLARFDRRRDRLRRRLSPEQGLQGRFRV